MKNNAILSLAGFEMIARKYEAKIDKELATIEMVSAFVPHCKIANTDQEIVEPYLQTQISSGGMGTCFMHRDDLVISELEGYVGLNAYDALENAPHNIKITIVDALFSMINSIENILPKETIHLNGTYAEKSYKRATEIVRLSKVAPGKKVALIGVVYDLARSIVEAGCELSLADFAQEGKLIHGQVVTKNYLENIRWADIAVVTGNILKTETIEKVFECAQKYSTKITVFAMTGSNIAPRYLNYGADLVTVEEFPFYWFGNTPSTLKVYSKEV